MNCKCQLSMNTKCYMQQYECILKEMIEKMTSVTFTESISGSFITQMIPHHCGAIEMSKNLLKYTTNIPLQDIALNIVSSQEKSIKNMTDVYPKCRRWRNDQRQLISYKRENERIVSEMFHEMKSACTDNNIDANFIREMIPHHRGAVQMSENALRFCLCPELIPLLESIIKSQKEGIWQMQQLLEQIECSK